MKDSLLERLLSCCTAKDSLLCVGIDPDPDLLPMHLDPVGNPVAAVRQFTREIIAATAASCAAYKFNLAFFEAIGGKGWELLSEVLEEIPGGTLTIADAKRGDIGNSAKFYAKAFFDELGFDAITLSPYMGRDSVLPFMEYDEKGVFLLVRTSNPGGNDFQVLETDGQPLFMAVAEQAVEWSQEAPGMLGFVVGATDVGALARLRDTCPHTPFLIPGVGAQGGNADAVVRAAGTGPMLVNSSRKIIYASKSDDFAERAGVEAARLRDKLRSACGR